jgi:hypothetical protein
VSDITLVRQQPAEIPEAEKLAARNVLFGIVDGLGEQGKRQWRRFFNRLMRLEPGEIVEIRTHQERIGWYHRKHMALEQRIFEAQEKFDSFEQFRVWLKVGAGFVDWLPGPKGGVIPVPRSISYARLEQGDMEKVHADIVEFLRTEHAGRTLWKHLSEAQRIEQIEFLLAGFGE